MLNKLFRGITENKTIRLIQFIVNCLLIVIASFSYDELYILVFSVLMLLGIWGLSLLLKLKSYNWSVTKALKSHSTSRTTWHTLFTKDFMWDSFMLIFYFGMMILLINIDVVSRKTVGQIIILIAIFSIIIYLIYNAGTNSLEREQAQMVLENMRQIMQADNERNQAAVTELFRRQFDAVDRFAILQYECADDRKLTASYGREAVKLIKSLAPDSSELIKLEQYINTQRNNLMQRLYEAFPQLSKIERLIFMYAVIGLSPRAMSVLLGINIESIYNRKSRLKAKLKSGPSELADALR